MKLKELRFRQIHLDFHTSPHIPDVGRDFDAREFARVMKEAHVDSVTVFAKCHHGHLYYNTKHPARHPGLKHGLNMLGEQIEALHREGIRAPIYISVLCDELAANNHPEWIARQADGKPVGAGPFDPGWQILDMASPYQEYVVEQTREVLKTFHPVDGIFFDMCWDQPSCSNYSVEAMCSMRLNPESEEDRLKFANVLTRTYMRRLSQLVWRANRNASIFFNGRQRINADVATGFRPEMPSYSHIEIESLPSGFWGYNHFPLYVRHFQTYGMEMLGMTARFHKSWADFGGLKNRAALEFECFSALAHGAKCSVGDQLHPRGKIDRTVYAHIGEVFRQVEEKEAWCRGTEAMPQIGVLAANAGPGRVKMPETDEGAMLLLQALHHQFQVIDESVDFSRYEVLIAPDVAQLSDKGIQKLRKFLRTGGKLLFSYQSLLDEKKNRFVLPECGLTYDGAHEFTPSYIAVKREIQQDVERMNHVMYEANTAVRAKRGTETLAQIVDPYFNRTWEHFSSHFQTPDDKPSRHPAVTRRANVIYIASPIFKAYIQHGNHVYKTIVRNCLNLLLTKPTVRGNLPGSAIVTVRRQQKRVMVHVLYYTPQRRTRFIDLVEDVIPLHDVELSVRTPTSPRRVFLAPGEHSLPFEWRDGCVKLRVPEIRGHQMICLDNAF